MKRTFFVLAALVLALAGCKSSKAEDPLLQLSAEESLIQGKELLANQKYSRARPYFTHAFEVEPNSATGREGLLLAADTYYLEEGSTNFIQAEAKYRDYLNRFPTSEQAAYVQFQIANSLAKRMEKPDRDQTVTRKAMEAYQELIRLYPTSEYAAQAQEQMLAVNDNLAEHEFIIGRFYLRYGSPKASVERFEYILGTFPKYRSMDKLLFHLAQAYELNQQQMEALKTFERLQTDFPQSQFIQSIPPMYKEPQKAGA